MSMLGTIYTGRPGLNYKCNLTKEQIIKFLDEIFGYHDDSQEYRENLGYLLGGSTLGIPVTWIGTVPEVRATKKDGIQILSHASSDQAFFVQKIHPAVRAWLEREGIDYNFECDYDVASFLQKD